MVLLQLQEDQQPLVVVILRLLAIRLRVILEQGYMVMLFQPAMGPHSRQHTAKLCKGMGFLLEVLKVQPLPHMAILNHLAVEVLLLHKHKVELRN